MDNQTADRLKSQVSVNRFLLAAVVVLLGWNILLTKSMLNSSDNYVSRSRIESINSRLDINDKNIDKLFRNDSVIVANQNTIQSNQQKQSLISFLLKAF
jgi:hypothetical protein